MSDPITASRTRRSSRASGLPVAGRPGFSLVEILVATGVMVAVILPIILTFTQSVRQTEISLDEILAMNLAEELADQILLVPYVAGFSRFPSYPAINPAPDYPQWREYRCPGMTFPPATPGMLLSIETTQFTSTGVPYAQDETPKDLEPYVRLYLSPLPDRFKRKVKVHRATDHAGSAEEDPNLVLVESEASWEDRAIVGPHPRRQISIKAIVSNPTLGWGGL